MTKPILSFALLLLCLSPIAFAQAPKGDGTERKTAHPWTGDPLEFEYPNREKTLKLDTVFKELNIGKGSVVADVGAGGGWLSVHLARQVGTTGTVYAEEILPKYVTFLKKRADIEKAPQMKPILGFATDPKLPSNLDAVVILNAYHEFDAPIAMLRKIKDSMKPRARLGFIERDNNIMRQEAEDTFRATGKIKRTIKDVPDGRNYTDDHLLAMPIVKREAASVGFRPLKCIELGDDNYLLVVEKPR